jgi:hypothetical protein
MNRNGSIWPRHLLPVTAFSLPANLKKALNAQQFSAFPQDQDTLHRSVASS